MEERQSILADGQPCYSNSTDAAHESMAEQRANNPHRLVSLDEMWRAAGTPEGKSPDAWLGLAKGLLKGLDDYGRKVHAIYIGADNPEAPFCGGPKATRTLQGDLVADEEVAVLYAMFLDSRGMMRCFVGAEDLEAVEV